MSKPKRLRKLIKAAKRNDVAAMYLLGLAFERKGLTERAAEWVARSAEEGYLPAIEWMNDYYYDDGALVQAYS